MDDILAWASAQPVWLQVFIGLCLFFVGLPSILLTGYWLMKLTFEAFDALRIFFEAAAPVVLFVLAVGFGFSAIGWIAFELGPPVAFRIGDAMTLSPEALAILARWISIGLFIVVVTVIVRLVIRLPVVRDRLHDWRADLERTDNDGKPPT